MEGIREIAKSYHSRASEEEKNSAKRFFDKLDINGDGKISFEEIKNNVCSWLSTEEVFKELDSNGDGALDFNEFLCVYYMEKRLSMVRCSECFDLLAGAYFSCLLCLGKSPDTYDLCCYCYRKGNLSHEHSSEHLVDHHSLVKVLRDRTAAAESAQRKREMEEVREIATVHFQAASPHLQFLAFQFHQSMDTDGDGRVNLSEFLAFMNQQGYTYMKNPSLFRELDRDGDGALEFLEVMTLFYIIKSGRPFCGCCGRFVPGLFFSCVECFNNRRSSYDVCPDCYRSSKCSHSHNGRAQFLDSYTLLQCARDPALAQASGFDSKMAWTNPSNAAVPMQNGNNMHLYNSDPTYHPFVGQLQNQAPIYPSASVPATNGSNWKGAAFELALEFGTNAGASACIIM